MRRNLGRPGFRVETSDGDDRGRQRGGRHRTLPAPCHSRPSFPTIAGISQIHSNAYRNPDQLPEGRGAGGRCGLVGGADRRRALARGKTRLPLGRPARSAAARLSRARLLLVARRAGQVGRRDARPRHRARHDRGERRPWRPDRRLPAARRAGDDARRPDEIVRGRRADLRAGSGGQYRARRRQLPVAARRSRRLCRRQRPRPSGGAGGAQARARSAVRDQPRS